MLNFRFSEAAAARPSEGQCYTTYRYEHFPMPNPKCEHKRVQLVAKDQDSQYIECLDCGEILEVGELNPASEFGESLSDA